VADFLVDLAEHAAHPSFAKLRGQAETIKRGGTLITAQFLEIERSSQEFAGAMNAIRGNVGDLTRERPKETTLKSYNSKNKNGLAPHRDSNLGADPALIGMVSLRGLRQSALWVVPETVIFPGSDREMMERSTREACLTRIRGYLGPDLIELTPFDVATQAPGDVTLIDERKKHGGEWRDPKLGPVAIWHSVYAECSDPMQSTGDVRDPGYVLSLITRNRHANAAIV